MAARVNQENFQQEVLEAKGQCWRTLLGQLHSLKRLSPVLSELEETYGDALKVVKINVNFDMALAERYEVQAAPTLIFFQDGVEKSRRKGLVKKAELVEIIDSLK